MSAADNSTATIFSFDTFSRPDGSNLYYIYSPYEQNKSDAMYAYFDGIQKHGSTWQRLSIHGFIQAYSNVFLSQRRNVILISSATNATNSILYYGMAQLEDAMGDEPLKSNDWMCSGAKMEKGTYVWQPTSYLAKADTWTVYDHPIEYCLSEIVEDVYSVLFSMSIMILVIAFNVVKVVAMLWVLLRFDAEDILMFVGDAAGSFLIREDDITKGSVSQAVRTSTGSSACPAQADRTLRGGDVGLQQSKNASESSMCYSSSLSESSSFPGLGFRAHQTPVCIALPLKPVESRLRSRARGRDRDLRYRNYGSDPNGGFGECTADISCTRVATVVHGH